MRAEEDATGMRTGATAWAGRGVLLLVLYLLLTESQEPAEIVAGLIASALAALAVVVVRHRIGIAFAPRPIQASLAGRLAVQAVSDCWIVYRKILRCPASGRCVPGCFRVIPFDPGGDDPRSAARRAAVIFGVSLEPNSYVITIDRTCDRMMIHQLVSSAKMPGNGDREWPL